MSETARERVAEGYTAGERTRMIALRVAKDVGAIYGPDAATTVAELFDQHEAAFDTTRQVDDADENREAERPDTTVLVRLRDGTRIRSDPMPRTTAHELHSWILSYFPTDNVAADILQETVVWQGGFGEGQEGT